MSVLSAADLADLRATLQATMDTPCTIQRSGTTVLTTVCSIYRDQPVQIVATDRLQPELRWRVQLPYGADLQRGDVVVALGERYAVVEMLTPHTYATCTQALCLRIGAADDPATPGVDESSSDYLHANATIQLARYGYDAGTKHTTLHNVGTPFPARVDDAAKDLTEEGTGPAFDILVTCSAAIDIRDGDLIVSITPPVSALPTVGQVLHVSTKRINDGLSYKEAQVIEHVQAGGG